MIKNPLISIIIPTYNSGELLDTALSSIANQKYKNLEVLIVDGLSTDNTIEIAKSFHKKIKNLHIFSESDNGIYDAMNKGIKKANGEWLYFLGSDDSFYKDETLNEFNIINKENIDIIYGNVSSSRFKGLYDGEFSLIKLIKKNICHQSMFFRKDVFVKKGYFNLRYKSHADWDFNIRCFFSSLLKTKYADFTVANYSDDGFSSQNFDKKFNRIKPLKCLYLGYRKLPKSVIKDLIKQIIKVK